MSYLNTIDVIRAWKDPEYRLSLSEAEHARLPQSPAGSSELDDAALSSVNGGAVAFHGGFAIAPQPQAQQTITSTIDVCCSTGDLPCNGNTQDLLCIVVK